MKTNRFFSMALLVVDNSSCGAEESRMSAGAESATNRLRKNMASELKALPDHLSGYGFADWSCKVQNTDGWSVE